MKYGGKKCFSNSRCQCVIQDAWKNFSGVNISMKVYREGDYINIVNPRWKKIAFTNYSKELFDKISAVSWSKDHDYLRSKEYRKSLHQIVMIHWYGEAKFNEAKKQKFVIDHHNNNGFDCRIENLTFVSSSINKAKGFTYDKDRVSKFKYVAVNFKKNFHSKKYEVRLTFNAPTKYCLPNGNIVDLAALNLLYEDNFEQVLLDCQNILLSKPGENFRLNKLSYIGLPTFEEAQKIILNEDEKDHPIIVRNGQICIVQGREPKVIE